MQRICVSFRRDWCRLGLATLLLAQLLLTPTLILASSSPSATPMMEAGSQDPGANYRYTWTARNQSGFTPQDEQLLSRGFSVVIIEKSYDGGDFAAADAAARQLATSSGQPRVLANYLTTIITTPFLRQFGASFQDGWILRDVDGNRIPFNGHGQDRGWYVDLSNPAYRAFIEHQVVARQANAPYAGVMFDNFHVAAANTTPAQLPPGKAAQLDAALPLLIGETKSQLGSGKLVYVNGVSRGTVKQDRADRGFTAAAAADGVQDETFCFQDNANAFRTAADTWADIATYRALATRGTMVLHSVKIRTGDSQQHAAEVKRFCFGAFLMGYVPGHSLIQFKDYSNEDAGPQIEEDTTPEQSLGLGAPTADPVATGAVWSRSFINGWVAVNSGDSPVTVTVPANLVLRTGGESGSRVVKGSTVTIPARDATYFTNT